MPSTACTTPSSVRNSTTRSLIERVGSGTDPPLRRVERVAQAVADEVDADDDEDEGEPRKHGEPPLFRVVLAVHDQDAERGRRRLDPETEERQRRLGEDRGGDDKRGVHDDRAERVREDVPEHDPEITPT